MIKSLTKISLISGLIVLIHSCDAVKRVGADEFLLTENTVFADSIEVKDDKVLSQIVQKPNPRVLGIPFGIFVYNIADPYPDSTFQKWLHKNPKREQRLINFLSQKQVWELDSGYIGINRWFERNGSKPVVVQEEKTKKSLDRLKRYYSSFGWFNTEGEYKVIPSKKKPKRAKVQYDLRLHKPYIIDSINKKISSPVVDSLFRKSEFNSFIESGKQFANNDFVNERDRLTIQFRNSGLYYFDQDYITFDADTVNTGHKANITYIIPDREFTEGDSTRTEPFQIHTVNEVRIVTDYSFENRNKTLKDSATFAGYKLYSYEPLKFRPKAITDAISINPQEIFKDIDRTLTYNQLSELRIFKYPNISYLEDPADSSGTGLIANILLTPRKKYTLGVDFDVIPIPSPIQQFGMGFSSSFLIRNVFRGAETFEVSARGSVGSSKDAADSESSFFNISDIGGDVKLSLPRILFPINTENIIKKYMSPSTNLRVGLNAQNNIGLDRQNFSSVFNYRWKPTSLKTYNLDLFNVQYVRNLRTENYYRIYRSSYNRLNEIARDNNFDFMNNETMELEIPNEVNGFFQTALDPSNPLNLDMETSEELLSILERQGRLTENNLIFSTNFSWIRDTRQGLFDNSFSRLRWRLEAAGNFLSAISSLANLPTNSSGNREILGVVYSQYVKGEIEYIKHWQLPNKDIFALRGFVGLAVPYGNSGTIPFVRSYFAGGANDNRGWQPYDLGPGSSGSILDFDEANFKIAFNAEYRFGLLGDFKGALFVDVGNIWNLLDDEKIASYTFDGLQDLSELGVASGLGLRYDFGFFVFRLDGGFKTYNPARPEGARWFKEYNFANIVYNIGINYPF